MNPPPGPPTGNASSTDSGNSTYPRLKKQQNQQQQQHQGETGSGGSNSINPPAPLPKRANSESRLNLYYGGNWSLFLSYRLSKTNCFILKIKKCDDIFTKNLIVIYLGNVFFGLGSLVISRSTLFSFF
jgi:hypothetical protein